MVSTNVHDQTNVQAIRKCILQTVS